MTKTNFKFDKLNANKGTDRGRQLLAESLKTLGAGRSIVCDRNFNILAGNKTFEQAQALGLEVETIHTKGEKLVVVVRDDLDLDTDSKARALAFSDNRIAELDLNWSVEQILEDVDQINIEGLWTDEELARLQDGIDLASFEALADNIDEDEDNTTENSINAKSDSGMMPFNCLLTQQQRERVKKGKNQAKSKHGLETTAEALVVTAQEILNGQ